MNRRIFFMFLMFTIPSLINSSTTDFIKKENASLLELKNKDKIEYYKALSQKYSKMHNLDWKIVHSIVKVESNFNEKAIGQSKEIGLMQIKLSTAKAFNNDISKKQLFDAEINMNYGCLYFKNCLDKYNGNLIYASAAYNAGLENKNVYKSFLNKKDPPNKDYVKKIAYEKLKLDQLDNK